MKGKIKIFVCIIGIIIMQIPTYFLLIKETPVLNSTSFKYIELYRKEISKMNSTFMYKSYTNKYELLSEIKKITNKKFFNKFKYMIEWEGINEIYLENKVTFNEMYIPNQKEINILLQYKNKPYKDELEFKQFISSLNLNKNTEDLIRDVVERRTDVVKIIRNIYISFLGLSFLIFFLGFLGNSASFSELENNKEQLKEEEKENPEKIKPMWDYAKNELMIQLELIKKQANLIFKISIISIVIGLVTILISIFFIINNDLSQILVISTIGGILTEFIGATFLVMYKSLILQLNENLKILERLNFIGIGIKILDTMDENHENIGEVKKELAKKIIDKI